MTRRKQKNAFCNIQAAKSWALKDIFLVTAVTASLITSSFALEMDDTNYVFVPYVGNFPPWLLITMSIVIVLMLLGFFFVCIRNCRGKHETAETRVFRPGMDAPKTVAEREILEAHIKRQQQNQQQQQQTDLAVPEQTRNSQPALSLVNEADQMNLVRAPSLPSRPLIQFEEKENVIPASIRRSPQFLREERLLQQQQLQQQEKLDTGESEAIGVAGIATTAQGKTNSSIWGRKT
jgi:hypothetical protein